MRESGDVLRMNMDVSIQGKSLSLKEMEAVAKKLRRHIIAMTGKAGSGHPGGSLSAVEIVTALYFKLNRHLLFLIYSDLIFSLDNTFTISDARA